ncbi:hypothetical protein C8J57DRAFT_1505191 [Mycena rebaudengoi]|nr:hypothetical protein C8J57DRAFT_1505191 [Mycena rebaudengoi]
MLDHPSATIINPVLQPDSFWHQIAVLPSDWQDPRISADHRDRIISFEDMAEAWDRLAEHGFTVGTFHDPLIDGDDSAHVLSGIELRVLPVLSAPLYRTSTTPMSKSDILHRPHTLVATIPHSWSTTSTPLAYRYSRRPRVVCGLCCILGGFGPDFSSPVRTVNTWSSSRA